MFPEHLIQDDFAVRQSLSKRGRLEALFKESLPFLFQFLVFEIRPPSATAFPCSVAGRSLTRIANLAFTDMKFLQFL